MINSHKKHKFIDYKKLIYILFCISFFSCSNKIINLSSYKTTEQVELGIIGISKEFALEKSYNQTAIPKYNTPIKVAVKQEVFTKSKFKAFENAKSSSNKNINVVYVDSVDTKPHYLKLEIADRISVLDALNNKANTSVKEFLKVKYQGHLVSELHIAFSEQLQNSILNANEVFLQPYGVNSLALYLYNQDVLVDTIPFSKGVVFNYGSSIFCWKNTKYSQWDIVDVVPSNKRCPKGTFRSPKKVKSLNQYLRF